MLNGYIEAGLLVVLFKLGISYEFYFIIIDVLSDALALLILGLCLNRYRKLEQ